MVIYRVRDGVDSLSIQRNGREFSEDVRTFREAEGLQVYG